MQSELPNVETIALKINYRSQQQILDVAAALLKQDQARVSTLNPLTAHHVPADQEIRSPRLLRFVQDTNENKWIAHEIKRIVSERNIPIEDIVVLARSSYAMKGLMDVLKVEGLNPVLIGGARILDTQAANLVLTILRMLQFPQRNLFIWQLLRAYKIFISPTNLKHAMERAQKAPLLEVLQNHQLWLSSKNSVKIVEFLDIYRKAQAMLAQDPTSLDTVLRTAQFVIEKLEYKRVIYSKLSISAYTTKMREMSELFEYLESLGPDIDAKMEMQGTEKTCLETLLQSATFYTVAPQPGVSKRRCTLLRITETANVFESNWSFRQCMRQKALSGLLYLFLTCTTTLFLSPDHTIRQQLLMRNDDFYMSP